ncbi:antitoxin VbhA family protein [Hymenobacter sp. HDW8]|uniref:antitoxin VbhA family protein n=1 Tax=Hymenobacter sp. HDW8 TaxID=2714932 RepID=UPI0014095AF0|nr:antitoxin VbhA family protein [Hymenobacter sp. HDW8]QIL78429.1 antitoxin VbhA family protein [Hymenobacter sp. HDW8]
MKASLTMLRSQIVRPILTGNIAYFSGMEKPTFLPQEATEAQRREIINFSYAAGEAQGAIIPDDAKAAYNRYIAGEITLQQAVDAAMSIYQKQPAHS